MRSDILRIHTETLSNLIRERYTEIPPKVILSNLYCNDDIEIDILKDKETDKSEAERQRNYIKTEMDRALLYLSGGKKKSNDDYDEDLPYINTILIKRSESRTETYYKLNEILQIGDVNSSNVARNLIRTFKTEEYFDIYDESIRDFTHAKQKVMDDIEYIVDTITKVNCYIKESKNEFIYTLNEMLNIIAFDISIDINIKFNESEFKLSNVKPKQLIYNDESIDIKFEECQFRIKSFKDIKYIQSSNKDSIDKMITESEKILSEYDTDNVINFIELINQYKSIKESFEF